MDFRQRFNADKARAEALGWWATEGGGDNLVLLLTGGDDDDGHKVHVHIHYAPNFRTRTNFGQFRFVSAIFYWPTDGVDTVVRTQKLLWQRVETYAPKKES